MRYNTIQEMVAATIKELSCKRFTEIAEDLAAERLRWQSIRPVDEPVIVEPEGPKDGG